MNSHMRVHTYEFICDRSIVPFRTYDLVLLLFITFWKNVLLTSTWILGPAYTFVHCWPIMANLILPNIRSILTALLFFLPFLGFIAKSRYFFILEPFSLPNLFLCFFLIFYFILIPIASSFWFPPLIWWVGWLAELWGGRWRRT
jgi:hypothetical protein